MPIRAIGKQDRFQLNPDLPIHHFELPGPVMRKLIEMIHGWNLEFAAYDFILTAEDKLGFIEANVEGNWLWIEHELDQPISKSIAESLWN